MKGDAMQSPSSLWAKDCLVTMLAKTTLDQQVGQGVQSCTQNRNMKGAYERWQQAKVDGLSYPVVFLDASDGGIVYSGVITDMVINGDTTVLSYVLLKSHPRLSNTELTVQESAQRPSHPLPADFIRPYANCDTPAFIQ
jgi:hypothetical protein